MDAFSINAIANTIARTSPALRHDFLWLIDHHTEQLEIRQAPDGWTQDEWDSMCARLLLMYAALEGTRDYSRKV